MVVTEQAALRNGNSLGRVPQRELNSGAMARARNNPQTSSLSKKSQYLSHKGVSITGRRPPCQRMQVATDKLTMIRAQLIQIGRATFVRSRGRPLITTVYV